MPSPPHRRRPVFKRATGPMRWLLACVGAVAIVMPWGRAYFLPGWFEDRGTRRHELVHLRQVQRDGAVVFACRYLWWLARYGYWANPYEVEAYAVATPTVSNPRRMRPDARHRA